MKKYTKYNGIYIVYNAENKIGYYIKGKKMYTINIGTK